MMEIGCACRVAGCIKVSVVDMLLVYNYLYTNYMLVSFIYIHISQNRVTCSYNTNIRQVHEMVTVGNNKCVGVCKNKITISIINQNMLF